MARTAKEKEVTEKKCKRCAYTKDAREFYPLARSDDGLHPHCKRCCKITRGADAVRKRDKRNNISTRQYHRAIALRVEADRSVTLAKIYLRADGICASCNKWVQPRHASPDHIQPLSRGGTHTWGNMQLMHLKCNLRKGNRYA